MEGCEEAGEACCVSREPRRGARGASLVPDSARRPPSRLETGARWRLLYLKCSGTDVPREANGVWHSQVETRETCER
eukprot:601551-Prymnesium_polylepis.1